MRHSHFALGDRFYTRHAQSEDGWAKWRVTDIGRRTIIAIRVDETHTVKSGTLFRTHRFLNEAEATARGYFEGPPYSVKEHVFDENSLEACTKEPTDDL